MKKLNLIELACFSGLLINSVGLCGTITREFSESYDFGGDKVNIEVANGSIYIEESDDDEVYVDAEIEVRSMSKQAARELADNVKIMVKQKGSQLFIRVDQPGRRGDSFFDWMFSSERSTLTVNIEIQVPEGMDVSASAVNGTVEAIGLNGSAFLTTMNGKINAEDIHGEINAETTNGDIKIELDNDEPENDMHFHTTNGNIRMDMPTEIDVNVDISTINGVIQTDFPLEFRGEWGPKNIYGRINRGGPTLKLETINGNISLEEN
ncbi:MAG: hypothetical protein EHM72_00415 [Calditrichaeota bacterium]|nr:MAG: hypothetical protein EHM72_00415 [Calditrichota bacterium]